MEKEHVQDKFMREFAFTVADFNRIRAMLYQHAGISLNDSKQELVYSRLSRRLRATGIHSFADYIQLLESNPKQEWEAFINAMTTNLTSFFRESYHFPILADHMRLRREKSKDNVSLWCAACSTGEEPYSMAMTAVETFGTYTPPVRIIATDIDTSVLQTARQGIYPADRIAGLDMSRIKRFFLQGTGRQEGYVRVRKELRDLIIFRRINLLDDKWDLQPPVDAIFCRNVMIYFDKSTQLEILRRFVPLLRADGLVFAGHSENFYQADAYFRLRGKTVYHLAPNAAERAARR